MVSSNKRAQPFHRSIPYGSQLVPVLTMISVGFANQVTYGLPTVSASKLVYLLHLANKHIGGLHAQNPSSQQFEPSAAFLMERHESNEFCSTSALPSVPLLFGGATPLPIKASSKPQRKASHIPLSTPSTRFTCTHWCHRGRCPREYLSSNMYSMFLSNSPRRPLQNLFGIF